MNRNLNRALARLTRSSSESRKIAVIVSTTSGTCSGCTNAGRSTARCGLVERPPPTRMWKPTTPSARRTAVTPMSLISGYEHQCWQPVIVIDAGERAASHRARVIAAGAHARPADLTERLPDRRDVLDAQPVQLEVLPVRDVDAAARILVRDIGDAPHHVRRQ